MLWDVRIALHPISFEYAYLAAYGGIVDSRAQGAEIMVIAHTLEHSLLAVEEESSLGRISIERMPNVVRYSSFTLPLPISSLFASYNCGVSGDHSAGWSTTNDWRTVLSLY